MQRLHLGSQIITALLLEDDLEITQEGPVLSLRNRLARPPYLVLLGTSSKVDETGAGIQIIARPNRRIRSAFQLHSSTLRGQHLDDQQPSLRRDVGHADLLHPPVH